jgi:predicted O-methyltransferase YrrM
MTTRPRSPARQCATDARPSTQRPSKGRPGIVLGMIVTDAVEQYLDALRPDPDPVLAEMEAQADREGVPIVVPQTGALLQVLAHARGARRIVEVGTAIGVSTLYMARVLPEDGVIVSFEIDEQRHLDACGYLERAGVLGRADLRLQDAREGLESLREPFDMAFIDGVKAQYGDYFEALVPLLGPRAVLAVDNVLMSGTVAEGRGDGVWTDAQIETARAFNERLLGDERLSGAVFPVGDGVLVAVRV